MVMAVTVSSIGMTVELAEAEEDAIGSEEGDFIDNDSDNAMETLLLLLLLSLL